MDTNIRQYVRAGLTNAILELETKVSSWSFSVDKSKIAPYTKEHLIERLRAYKEIINKQKELAEYLDDPNIWSNKVELSRITKLIFQLSYFVEEDAEQIMTDIANGTITTRQLDTLN